jgi:FMN phosphatase YigB (HAD superfamily)
MELVRDGMQQECRKIALDVDGVILKYNQGLVDFAVSRGVRIGCAAHESRTWTMEDVFPDLDPARIIELIETFSRHEDFGRLKPFDGAFETIAALKEEFPAVGFVAITSAGRFEATRALRVANLAGLPFEEIHVLPLGASKRPHLERLPAGSVYVDDLKKHVEVAKSLGLQSILYRQSYNVEDDHDAVVADWAELGALIRTKLSAEPPARVA